MLFAQLVDDPSARPEEFPTEDDQKRERVRLHGIIAEMVPWEATNDPRILNKARFEIARSLARARSEAPPAPRDEEAVLDYLREHAPPVCDPFCGGGSIPLEAQRLGLRAYGSDLNPVAVLISKATCEIPPKFSDRPPVNPERGPLGVWKGAQGLAVDIRYYGRWMRDEAEKRIGHLYPKVRVTETTARDRPDLGPYVGQELTVIAWLWARTVASPDPMVRGAHVPLVSSFMLSTKKGKQAWVEVEHDTAARDGWRFVVKTGNLDKDEEARKKLGTKAGKAQDFLCALTGTPVARPYIQAEGKADRLSRRLMAVVTEAPRGRLYVTPTPADERIADTEEFDEFVSNSRAGFLAGATPTRAMIKGGVCSAYGLRTWGHLFTGRQLVALTTFSNLVSEAREKVKHDFWSESPGARASGPQVGGTPAHPDDDIPLAEGGTGAQAYADAVATYLAFTVSNLTDRNSALVSWAAGREHVRNTFGRQALPMVWDYSEVNALASTSGSFIGGVRKISAAIANCNVAGVGHISNIEACAQPRIGSTMVATDPPYYDNIGYADLSDFFYVWLRRTLHQVWLELFRRVLVPKDGELVATPYRHGGKEAAERVFVDGMGKALASMHASGRDDFPVTIYYAFKQSEIAKEGLTSPGWATFLHAVIEAGYAIDGTWPLRTELGRRMIGIGANALASSIVLVCRKRSPGAPVITRREFVARLRLVLPPALKKIRAGGVGPVDMAQASIGPGMGVFTACSQVLEPDDAPMTVRTAIALINQVRDEIAGEETGGYDADTRFCIDWFEAFGMDGGKAGDAITMAQAYDIGIDGLEAAGVFTASGGAARLLRRDELPSDWWPETDAHLTHWECAQHLARVLNAQDGGTVAAARLMAGMGTDDASAARGLAYRLYDICERKSRADEAQVWNMLAREWPAIEAEAQRFEAVRSEETLELDLQGGG